MTLIATCLTLALAAQTSALDGAEARLEARSARFEAVLDPAIARIDAVAASAIPAEARRAEVARILDDLRPIIADFARGARWDFEAMAVLSDAGRAAELRQYGDGLVAYLDRLPDEVRAGAERDIAHAGGE